MPRFEFTIVGNMMTKTHVPQNKRSTRGSLSRATFGAVVLSALLVGCSGNGLESSPGSTSDPSIEQPTTEESSESTPSPTDSPTATSDTSDPDSSQSSSTTTPSAESTPTGSTESGSPEQDATSLCHADDLNVGTRVPEGSGAAGSRYVLLTFQNASSSTCYLDGHPGVSFVGNDDGTQLGEPASHMSSDTTRVELEPEETTTALVRIGNAGNYDPKECAPTTADGFRVYPPDSKVSVFVPFEVQACQQELDQGPQMSVSAVGRSN